MHSVIISIYNHEEFLVEAVLSSVRQESVTEVLLIDDGSRDQSPELARRLSAQYPHKVRDLTPPGGGNMDAPARFNQLAERCTNEWISILNSDDTFTPQRFELINQLCLSSSPDSVSFIFGDLLNMDSSGACLGHKRALLDPEFPIPVAAPPASVSANSHSAIMSGVPRIALCSQNYLATTSNMTFTKALHQQVGGFRPYRYCHDWDFAFRACLLGRPRYVPHYFANYRIHRSNTISEGSNRVAQEVRQMFDTLLADFPQHFSNPEVQRWLASNYYLQH